MTVESQLTEFGEVLTEFMEDRGIPVTHAEIRALGERAGLDPEKLLARATGSDEHEGYLDKLAEELDLETDAEWMQLARAFAFERYREAGIEQIMEHDLDRHEAELMTRDDDLWITPPMERLLMHVEDEEAVEQWEQVCHFAYELAEMPTMAKTSFFPTLLNPLMKDAAIRARTAAKRARKRLRKKKAAEGE